MILSLVEQSDQDHNKKNIAMTERKIRWFIRKTFKQKNQEILTMQNQELLSDLDDY